MENAAKALLIAGGILVTIIILGMLVYGFDSIRRAPEQGEIKKRQEQLNVFNSEYESYHKKEMYGTDVITVINKAIDNNLRYAADDGVYNIDVTIKMKSSINASAIQYVAPDEHKVNAEYIIDDETGQQYKLGEVLEGNRTYRLLDTSEDGNKNGVNDLLEQVMQTGETKIVNVTNNELNYIRITTGFADFKGKFFRCANIGYSDLTGRVNLLEFEEL